MHLKRLLKFLHTLGAIGLMGAMASLMAMHAFLPEPAALAEYARLRAAMGGIANWIFMPSLVATLIGGLLAIAANRGYHDAGWVWVKLGFGIIVFEATLTAIHGPIRREAEASAEALKTGVGSAELGATAQTEWLALALMLAIATANVVIGIWRPQWRKARS